MHELTSSPNQDKIFYERSFTLDAHIPPPHLKFALLRNKTQVCGDQASFRSHSLTKNWPKCCSWAHMFVGIICPSFFLVSTWKVSEQKYPKDALILETCSCFYLEEIKHTYANPGYLLVVLCLRMWFLSHYQLLMYQLSFNCKVSATMHTQNL
jgi:hypothetical protein